MLSGLQLFAGNGKSNKSFDEGQHVKWGSYGSYQRIFNRCSTSIDHPMKPTTLAIVTVSVTVAATLTATGAFLMAIPLVLGLIAQTLKARRGRWLMWMGAALLSVTILQMELVILPELITELCLHHTLGGIGGALLPFWIASILLIAWCDLAFMIDAVKTSRNRLMPETCQPGIGDWIVWITAVLFSLYAFGGTPFLIRAYRQGFDRHDIVVTALALIVIAVVFDTALLIDATRMRQARRRSYAS